MLKKPNTFYLTNNKNTNNIKPTSEQLSESSCSDILQKSSYDQMTYKCYMNTNMNNNIRNINNREYEKEQRQITKRINTVYDVRNNQSSFKENVNGNNVNINRVRQNCSNNNINTPKSLQNHHVNINNYINNNKIKPHIITHTNIQNFQSASSISSIQSAQQYLHINESCSIQQQKAFLKTKLIQTHQKLLKQVQISKQLEDNFYKLKHKFQQNQKMSKQLLKQNEQLKVYLKSYKQKYSSNNSHNPNPNNQKKLLKQNEELKQNLQELSNKNIILKNDLQTMREKVLEMIMNKEKQQDKYQDINSQVMELKSKIMFLQDKYNKKDKQYVEKEELCQIWRRKYQKVQQQYKKIQQTYYKYQKQLTQTKNLSSQLHMALKQQKQKNAQMLNQIISVQMQVKQLRSKLQISQQDKKQLKNKLIQCQQQKVIKQQKYEIQQQLQKLMNEYNNCLTIIKQKDKQIIDIKNSYLEKQIERQNKEKYQKYQKNKPNSNMMNNMSNNTMNNINNMNMNNNIMNNMNSNIMNNMNMIHNNNNNNNMSSVKMFVNRLQQQSNNNIKRQIKHNPNNRQKSKSPLARNNNNEIKPSLGLKNIDTNNQHQQYYYQNNNNVDEIIFDEGSYEDSLQRYKGGQNRCISPLAQNKSNLSGKKNSTFKINSMKNNMPTPNNILLASCKHSTSNNKNILIAEPQSSQSELLLSPSPTQKNLKSYKQQKQQYLSILSQVGDKQTQLYNLNIEKNKILDELDRIQKIKVKNKQIINKRRQLESMLLANDKKHNQIKDQLKRLRAGVV